ncbi:glucan endo-1,3-beta-glucosidase 12-like [Macadamia integrifolia]|uniref:glucan endo-1,3-beta-glucosidase 12-like n=1 Tax=Macadamia integrifolia TaxID=60698 RepID=UPI001C4EF10A|nr:glucan endo-1,3-beta-glucosidase 12-like [Macadamia integrifolia]
MSLSSENLHLLFFFFFLAFQLSISGASSRAAVGVTISSNTAAYHPRPERVASVLRSLKITCVRLAEPNPEIIRAFTYSDISLLLSIPNSFVPGMASNQSNALKWLSHQVVPFHPRALISSISVGDDVLNPFTTNLSDSLLPAIRNVYGALHQLGISKISVSTTVSFADIVTTAFPPSSAVFRKPIAGSLMKPLLEFLSSTNSSLLINLNPYILYRSHPEIPIGFALFQEQPFNFRDDHKTGVRYRNLFDTMVDSVITATAAVGHYRVPVIIAETGWPSHGGKDERDATEEYAQMYNTGLVRHLQSSIGTPLRREGVAETYIYELFDEDGKKGPSSERHWGILYPNLTKKYEINFSGSVRIVGRTDNWLERVMVSLFLALVLVEFLVQELVL